MRKPLTYQEGTLRAVLGCLLLLLFATAATAQVIVTPDDNVEETYYEEEYEGGYEERQPLREAQPRDFDRERWLSLTKDLNYNESPITEEERDGKASADRSRKERSDESSRPRPRSSGGDGAGGSLSFLVKVLGIILGLAALIFLLLQIFGGDVSLFQRNRKLSGGDVQIDLENIEENLEQTELETFIQRAVREERYRLAVRLYYLDTLKALSANGVVRWKRDKTNGEYLRALRGHPLHDDFAAATRTFERVWYGRAELSAEAFRAIEPGLQSLTRAAGAATPAA